jgi:phage shock protein E
MSTIKELVAVEGATVIDVRGSWEFESGHVNGAINIPLDEIPTALDEIKDMKQPIIVYCRSGNRSAMAQQFLMQGGIARVVNGGGLGDMQIALM